MLLERGLCLIKYLDLACKEIGGRDVQLNVLCYCPQDLVTDDMPHEIANNLEVIQLNINERERMFGALVAIDFDLRPLMEISDTCSSGHIVNPD